MSAQPLEIRMAHLEGAYEQISERLRGIDGRLTALDQKIDSRFDRLDQKIDQKIGALDQKMDSRFDTFDKKLTTIMVTYLGTSAALTAAIIGVVVTHH
jgi:tetrahydromethanopterin S-methyltransferase subunit G